MNKDKQIEEISKILTEAAHKACEDVPFAPPNEYDRCIRPTMECHRCKEARALIEAGYHKRIEWISVEDRLPKEGARVLVWLKGDGSNYTSIDTDRLSLKKWVRWGRLVTHWMPLPEAPKMKGGTE